MITAFKHYIKWLLAGECAAVAIAYILSQMGFSNLEVSLLFIGMTMFCLMMAMLQTNSAHQKLLSLLFLEQNPQEFVKAYEPLCHQKKVAKRARASMLANLSSGYSVAGEFEKALEILAQMSQMPGAEQVETQLVIAGNRCSVYLSMEDAEKAREQYDHFVKLLPALSVAQRRQHEDSTRMLGYQLSLLEGTATQEMVAFIQAKHKLQEIPYYKSELSYYLAWAYQLLGERELAQAYYRQAGEAGEATHVSRQAKSRLETL